MGTAGGGERRHKVYWLVKIGCENWCGGTCCLESW